MNHTRGQSHLPILVLIALMLVGCAGESEAPAVVLSPTTEVLSNEPAELPSAIAAEPIQIPTRTLAPPSPTRTPFPTSSPVPTITFPELTGDYMGQELPGMTPVLFAPGIISTGLNERNITISPEGDEIFYSIVGKGFSVILWVKRVNGVWQEPQVAAFSGVYSDQDPAFAPDGERLFYASNRPIEGDGPSQSGFHIFFVEREGDGWGDPQSVGETVNQGYSQVAPSVAADGTLYFQVIYYNINDDWEIYRSRLVNGIYQASENLGEPVSSILWEHYPSIAPDQSYLLFGRDGLTLNISWQQADGTWTNPKELTMDLDLGLASGIWGAVVTPDGKVIFITTLFTSEAHPPPFPPGFDLVREVIGDDVKIADLFEPDNYLDLCMNIYWISSAALPGRED